MIIVIDTVEALNFSLSIQDCAVLDVMRKLIADDKGATETHGNRTYKWLSNQLILNHIQCATFTSPRQLSNIIAKLIACGLILKRSWYSKPYYTAITKNKQTATAAPRRQEPRPMAAPSAPTRRAAAPTVAPPCAPPPPPNDPTPEEIAAAFKDLDNQIENHQKTRTPNGVPNREKLEAFAYANHFKNFDVAGFIDYNSARNWNALWKTDWKNLAAQWYKKQIEKQMQPITYDEYCNLCLKDRNNGYAYKFFNRVNGVSYYIRRTPEEIAAAIKAAAEKK